MHCFSIEQHHATMTRSWSQGNAKGQQRDVEEGRLSILSLWCKGWWGLRLYVGPVMACLTPNSRTHQSRISCKEAARILRIPSCRGIAEKTECLDLLKVPSWYLWGKLWACKVYLIRCGVASYSALLSTADQENVWECGDTDRCSCVGQKQAAKDFETCS